MFGPSLLNFNTILSSTYSEICTRNLFLINLMKHGVNTLKCHAVYFAQNLSLLPFVVALAVIRRHFMTEDPALFQAT
jgi:hypothetical protein